MTVFDSIWLLDLVAEDPVERSAPGPITPARQIVGNTSRSSSDHLAELSWLEGKRNVRSGDHCPAS